MPYSARENDYDVRALVSEMGIRRVLDVGAGSGTYGKLLGELVDRIDAVEVWEPYVEQFGLDAIYDNVIVADALDYTTHNYIPGRYDLVIFGDVLEHMTQEQALDLWDWARDNVAWGMISLPVVHWPQGEVEGNPYEAHVQEHVDVDELREKFGPFDWVKQYELTGTFVKRFV